MEDEMILKQPADRRLAGDTKDLPPGPPGAENDEEYNDTKKEEKSIKESSKSRRRSPSGSPPSSKRKSPSRGPPRSPRGRRTPSPRRRFGRNRNDYSPDRRRFNDRGRMRRSPLRNRSRDRMDHRRNGRDRFRGRRDSRSRSRSNSPIGRRRWSPKKKPSSPPIPPPGAQYSVTAPGLYPDAYTAYGQYGPPQQAYGPGDFVGAPPQATFAPGYPPPPTWGVPPESYQQPNWVPQTDSMPPVMMQQQPSGVVQQTVAVQPPGTQAPPPTLVVVEKKNEVNPTHDAVAQEAENQRDELKKQRTSYLKKTAALKKELKVLKDQRKDLIGGTGSHSPTTKGFLDENERLQSQIQKKLSTIENVIDMLTGIIGEENLSKEDAVESPKKHSKKKRSSSSSSSDDSSSSNTSSSSSSSSSSESDDNSSPERLKSKAIESMKQKRDGQGKALSKDKKVKEGSKKTDEKKINYVFYDPEMHWCKICDSFPKTAKDYLTHLHSKDHADNVETMETPWHNTMTSDEYPSFEGAPIKRTPIRGLTFFVPATSWYCKICSIWMGDLHCASLHLKSRTHSHKYTAFLEKNPHYEVDWLAERQRQLNEKKSLPPQAPQITTLSTTDVEPKENKTKSKHVEEKEKSSKKRKKKNSEKKDKKKKKRSKKRKKAASSSSSNDSTSETEAKSAKKKQLESQYSSGPAAPSIRVQMRNLQKEKEEIEYQGLAPPPPPKISELTQPVIAEAENIKKDDLISQWNIVQSVISDSEKKLLEQLKGKLKNKPPEVEKKKEEKDVQPPVVQFIKANEKKSVAENKERVRSPAKREDDRNGKEKDSAGGSAHRRRSRSRPSRRSRSRSPSAGRTRRMRRSRSRGGGIRRSRSRGRRSPSRSRFSPRGYGRRRRSRSQARRRSRSHGRSRRRISSSRSRSRSGSSHRIEKAIVRQPEFRPRVPVTDANNVKKSKTKTGEEKEDRKKSSSKSSASNKKLPFIGRMPVFKKQSQNSENPENSESEKKEGEEGNQPMEYGPAMGPVPIMQDSYVHAGYEPSLMSEYEDLMPDPVQFVSLMGAPPPPPSQPPPQQYVEEEKDILPPGIDETESEFVPKPISDAPIPRKGPLPKDFEEALNIIFPGDKKPDDSSGSKSNGETQIITDEPVMQQSDLLKEGIHMMTVEETSLVGMDEASQMSMNEPLQFNKPTSSVATTSANNSGENSVDKSPPQADAVEEAVAVCISAIPPPPPPPVVIERIVEKASIELDTIQEKVAEPADIPSPPKDLKLKDSETKFEVIDQPSSPTDSEKYRRQEELDDLAMLGIDADDMAAMCI